MRRRPEDTDDATRGAASSRRFALCCLAIFMLAFILRGLYLLELASSPLLEVLVGDGRQYYAWAVEIAGGEWLGSETFYQAPLYPYAMAALLRLFGPELWSVRLLQILLGSTSCVLIALAGRRFFSYPVGLLAGLSLSLYPPAIFFDGLIQKTSFSLFFMTALLALASTLAQPDKLNGGVRWPRMVLLGIVLGALALTRENALILVPVLGACVVIQHGALSRRVTSLGWFGVGFALVLVPVGIRNFVVSDEFLPTTSQLGTNFFIGNNADADGRYRPLQAGREDARVERQDAIALAELDLGRSLTAGEVSTYWLERSWSYIRAEPWGWSRLLLRKTSLLANAREVVDTESIEAYRDHSTLMRVSSGWFHWGVLGPLALLGLWATRGQWRRLWILYAVELSLASSLILFYVMARYRAPLIPVAILFAAAGLDELYRSVVARSGTRVAASVALVAIAGAVQNRPLPIETYPRATTYYNVGVALHESGQLGGARDALEKALRILPHFADGHFSLGNLLSESGKSSQAMAHYREALALDPKHAAAGLRLARLLADTGNRDEAMRQYRAVLETAPDDAATLVNVAHLLSQMGDLAEATSYLEHALSVDPHHAMAHNLLANIRAHEGRLGDAVDHYEAALAIDPHLTDAHFKLSVLFSERGRLEAALRHLEETTRSAPNFAEGHLMLADVLERLGRTDEAAVAQRRARELEGP